MNERNQEIERLVKEHQGFVKSLAVKFAPMPGISEDIAQQVFLEFVEHKEKWDLEKDIKPLLAGITRNISLRYWREKQKQMSPALQKLAEHIHMLAQEDDESEWHYTEKKKALDSCLDKLPEKSRKLVEIHYYLGLTSQEIGGRMAMTAEAVRKALFRLRKGLKKCIEEVLAGIGYAS
ncbi:RNA polymerase sigma factor [Planctomycetota bacterium]